MTDFLFFCQPRVCDYTYTPDPCSVGLFGKVFGRSAAPWTMPTSWPNNKKCSSIVVLEYCRNWSLKIKPHQPTGFFVIRGRIRDTSSLMTRLEP